MRVEQRGPDASQPVPVPVDDRARVKQKRSAGELGIVHPPPHDAPIGGHDQVVIVDLEQDERTGRGSQAPVRLDEVDAVTGPVRRARPARWHVVPARSASRVVRVEPTADAPAGHTDDDRRAVGDGAGMGRHDDSLLVPLPGRVTGRVFLRGHRARAAAVAGQRAGGLDAGPLDQRPRYSERTTSQRPGRAVEAGRPYTPLPAPLQAAPPRREDDDSVARAVVRHTVGRGPRPSAPARWLGPSNARVTEP